MSDLKQPKKLLKQRVLCLLGALGILLLVALPSIASMLMYIGHENFGAIAISSIMLLATPPAIWFLVRSLWLRNFALKPKALDQVSLVSGLGIFVLPATAGICSLMISAGIAMLTYEEAFPMQRTVGVEIIAVGLVLTLAVPYGSLKLAVQEQRGQYAAIFDATAPVEAVRHTLERRWSGISERRRWWLRSKRCAALGSLDEQPETAWPLPGSRPFKHRPALDLATRGSSILFVASALTLVPLVAPWSALNSLADVYPAFIGIIAVHISLIALPVMLVGWYSYSVLMGEQGEAHVLRIAHEELHERESVEKESRSSASGEESERIAAAVAAVVMPALEEIKAMMANQRQTGELSSALGRRRIKGLEDGWRNLRALFDR